MKKLLLILISSTILGISADETKAHETTQKKYTHRQIIPIFELFGSAVTSVALAEISRLLGIENRYTRIRVEETREKSNFTYYDLLLAQYKAKKKNFLSTVALAEPMDGAGRSICTSYDNRQKYQKKFDRYSKKLWQNQ